MKIKLPSFELNILATIIVFIIIIGSIGVYSYQTMTGMVNSISNEANPDLKLTLLKDIFSDLSDAESNVKSYSITNNSEYIPPFYRAVLATYNKIHKLNKVSKGNLKQQSAIDSISAMIEVKFFILKKLIHTPHNDRVENTLTRLSKKITDSQKKENINNIARKPEVNLRAFKHEEVKKNAAVQEEIAKIEEQEAKFTEGYRKEQMELTLKDKVVTDKIRSLILRLENEEGKNILLKSFEAKNMATKANRLIAVFCAIVSILLFVLGYEIIYYFRKNKAYRKALNKAKTEAENLAKAKETFLANMSHEMRTPMNAIAGFTEQVLKSSLQPKQREQLDIVKKSSDHLLKIINEILDLSKLGVGKLEFERIAFNPVEIFEEVVMLMKHEAEKKHLKLFFLANGQIPPLLIGDPMRLKQILINLTGNAIKFTDAGEVKIEVSSKAEHEKKIFLKVIVTDTGIGIPKQDLASVFKEFKQAESSTSRKYGGTGLGLSICKKLVELQNGNIHMMSEESKGTSVIFTLPFMMGSVDDIVHEIVIDTDNDLLKGKKILIADDSEFNRKLIASILSDLNVVFTEAINGKEVISLVKDNDYDAILMDMLMPEMNGLEATEYIRKNFKGKKAQVPIIAFTAAVSDDIIKQCTEAGMNDFLSKPFKENELIVKLISVINPKEFKKSSLKKSIKKVELSNNLTDKNKQNLPLYTLDILERTANGDEKFVKEMIEIFIRTTNDGIKEIKKSYRENDYEKVADQAHLIASPCRHIEALSLLHIIKNIEDHARAKGNLQQLNLLIEKMEKETEILIPLLQKEVLKRQF